MSTSPPEPRVAHRPILRERLLAARALFAQSPAWAEAQSALAGHLRAVLAQLEPECLGVYWPVRFEFNAALAWTPTSVSTSLALALPFARRTPHQMHYRRWDGATPSTVDECGIASCKGAEVVPDVVLVPCVGYTASGCRLGYGGGYFDRWLAAHPHVTAVGVAWAASAIDSTEFDAQPHDLPLAAVVTEQGVVG